MAVISLFSILLIFAYYSNIVQIYDFLGYFGTFFKKKSVLRSFFERNALFKRSAAF